MKTSAFLKLFCSLFLMSAVCVMSCSEDDSIIGVANGHEWVDLGLSVKWATMNVGATSPSDYGDYFAWGETRPKAEYTEENCLTWNKQIGDIAGNASYDAARANWGGDWRLPTRAEWQELSDECTWEWASQGGTNGYRVTSKTNGRSIFLPAAGCRNGTSLDDVGAYGGYWSSTPREGDARQASGLNFFSSYRNVSWFTRYGGVTVRAVRE